MRPLSWLHISDLHLRVSEAWHHDIVLRAICESVERLGKEGTKLDFILVTGDLAFSGAAEEYTLVADFFDAYQSASEDTPSPS